MNSLSEGGGDEQQGEEYQCSKVAEESCIVLKTWVKKYAKAKHEQVVEHLLTLGLAEAVWKEMSAPQWKKNIQVVMNWFQNGISISGGWNPVATSNINGIDNAVIVEWFGRADLVDVVGEGNAARMTMLRFADGEQLKTWKHVNSWGYMVLIVMDKGMAREWSHKLEIQSTGDTLEALQVELAEKLLPSTHVWTTTTWAFAKTIRGGEGLGCTTLEECRKRLEYIPQDKVVPSEGMAGVESQSIMSTHEHEQGHPFDNQIPLVNKYFNKKNIMWPWKNKVVVTYLAEVKSDDYILKMEKTSGMSTMWQKQSVKDGVVKYGGLGDQEGIYTYVTCSGDAKRNVFIIKEEYKKEVVTETVNESEDEKLTAMGFERRKETGQPPSKRSKVEWSTYAIPQWRSYSDSNPPGNSSSSNPENIIQGKLNRQLVLSKSLATARPVVNLALQDMEKVNGITNGSFSVGQGWFKHRCLTIVTDQLGGSKFRPAFGDGMVVKTATLEVAFEHTSDTSDKFKLIQVVKVSDREYGGFASVMQIKEAIMVLFKFLQALYDLEYKTMGQNMCLWIDKMSQKQSDNAIEFIAKTVHKQLYSMHVIINNAKYDNEGSTGLLWDDLVQASMMRTETITGLLSEWFFNDKMWGLVKGQNKSTTTYSNNSNNSRYTNNNSNNTVASAVVRTRGAIVHKPSDTPTKQVCIQAVIKRAITTAQACPHPQCKFRHDIKRSEMAEVVKAVSLIKDADSQRKVRQHMKDYPTLYPVK